MSTLGKTATHSDRGVPMARSTWLWRGGNGRSYSQPSRLPPCLPGARWSTGVIMYTLLAGSPPFWHRKQMLMLRMIMSGNYQFGSPEWDDYSDTVKDLVRGQACWEWGGISCCRMEDPPGKTLCLVKCSGDPALVFSAPLPYSLRFPASWW